MGQLTRQVGALLFYITYFCSLRIISLREYRICFRANPPRRHLVVSRNSLCGTVPNRPSSVLAYNLEGIHGCLHSIVIKAEFAHRSYQCAKNPLCLCVPFAAVLQRKQMQSISSNQTESAVHR